MEQTPAGVMRLSELTPGRVVTLKDANLPRLGAAVALHGEASGRFEARREGRRAFLSGTGNAQVAQTCQRCLGLLERDLTVAFDLELVSEEQLARRQRDGDAGELGDLYVVSDGHVDLRTLLEDELLLAIDARPCRADPCSNMPAMAFGPEDAGSTALASPATSSQGPFAGLKDLLAQESDETQSAPVNPAPGTTGTDPE
ncbi:MAG: YceD family protein [Pseudomonadota bacterium]